MPKPAGAGTVPVAVRAAERGCVRFRRGTPNDQDIRAGRPGARAGRRPALAYADSSCAAQATDKKLAGAAKDSFLKKCAKDATAACDTQAADKKLAGAAKNSFVKKCVSDATGG